jgi:cob(I)alamin adenosyltransferase
MGLARALSQDEWVRARLFETQRDLFTVAAELATDVDQYGKFKDTFKPVTAKMTARLERQIDEMDSQIQLPRAFIIPGASPASAALDLARTVMRRAEREIVALDQSRPLANPEILKFVNRCSDFLFMLGRFEDRALPYEQVTDTRVARPSEAKGKARPVQPQPGPEGGAGRP